MQFIVKTVAGLSIAIIPFISWSQSTYLPQSNKHQQFLERLEIMMQRNLKMNVENVKNLSRRTAVEVTEYADSLDKAGELPLSKVDRYNLRSLLMNNSEWVQGDRSDFESKHPVWNTFYKTKANLFEVNEKDFFLAVNPVFQGQYSKESDYSGKMQFVNSKGLTLRGMIANRLGFSAYVVDNQERGPAFQQEWIANHNAVPGVGFYKTFKNTGVDYFDARGSINFSAVKNYLDFQFGYDKMFMGNGYRSLFLSDFANSFLFLKISARIWKFDYTNIWTELTPQTIGINAGNKVLDKKYAVFRHLGLQATKWLNVGLFEAVVFGRENHFDFTYLNPVMFLRVSEQQNGSADNAMIGFDFKANVAKTLQFYGQVAFDEFKQNELRSGKGWWANKFAIQLGGKYINAFKVNNLDLQGEVNLVRPFMYTHFDSVSNYTHYNQPLAHPLGANFVEAIGIIRYQPIPKLTTSARLILWQQGTDTTNSNFGTDIFKMNYTRSSDYGFKLPAGPKSKGVNAQFLVSYELKENLFVDGSVLVRRLSSDVTPDRNTNLFTIGLRLNMHRREYDY